MLFQLYKAITKHYQESPISDPLRNTIPFIYANNAPVGTEYPLITFEDVSDTITRSFCNNIEEVTIRFNCYSKTSYESLWVQEQIKKIYSNKRLTIEDGEYKIINASVDNESSEYQIGDNVFNKTINIKYTIREN